MTEKHEVIVVIPYYHSDLSEKEIISLKQVQKVLKKYDLCFIAPLRLKPFFKGGKYQVEYFENGFFESVSTYNLLMLTSEFYERFIRYRYMLIYQLDAFVFYDRLSYFCNLSYDYIGSPWIYPEIGMIGDVFRKAYVGNGGLSLRNVYSCIKLLNDKKKELGDFTVNEDFFFSGVRGSFKAAPLSIACEFSFETHVRKCFELNDRKLPFGCHAWERYDYSFWKPYIEEQGYDLSNLEVETGCEDAILDKTLEEEKYKLLDLMQIIPTVVQRLLKRKGLEQKHFIVWGAGKSGRYLVELFLKMGMSIDYVIDENKMIEDETVYKVPVVNFQTYKSLNLDNIIIVAVKRFMNEIQETLEQNNYIRRKDYITILDLLDMFYIEVLYGICKE